MERGRLCRILTHAALFLPRPHKRRELDREGYELPDQHAAWSEAMVTAGQMLQCLGGQLTPHRQVWRMEVVGESRNTLYVLRINAEKRT